MSKIRHTLHGEKGLTLVELLVAMVLVGVVIGIVVKVLAWGLGYANRGQRSFDMTVTSLDVFRELSEGFRDNSHTRRGGLLSAADISFKATEVDSILEYTDGLGEANNATATVNYTWQHDQKTLTRTVAVSGESREQALMGDVVHFGVCSEGMTLVISLHQKGGTKPVSQSLSETKLSPRVATLDSDSVPPCL